MNIVAMMVVGVYVYLIMFDRTLENNIVDKTAKFVNECETTGMISTSNYNRFTKDIYEMGNYSIEMEYNTLTSYPKEDANGNVIGFFRDYYTYNNKQILDAMFTETENHDYTMKTGDILTAKVRREGTTKVHLFRALFNLDLSETIIVNYSGTIGNNTVR